MRLKDLMDIPPLLFVFAAGGIVGAAYTALATSSAAGTVAAWVQAVGSVGAIGAAIVIARQEHQRSKDYFLKTQQDQDRERHLRGRSLAIMLYPALRDLGSQASNVFNTLKDRNERPWHAPQMFELDAPPFLYQVIPDLHLLGEDAAPAVQDVIYELEHYRRWLDHSRTLPESRNEAIIRRWEWLKLQQGWGMGCALALYWACFDAAARLATEFDLHD